MDNIRKNEDEIDLRILFSVLWSGKYFIIFCTAFSLLIGSLYLRDISPKYRVSVLLAPVQEEQSTPNFRGLGGLASLAGVSLPTGSASDFTKFEIMLKTQEISTLVFAEKNLVRHLFAGEWDENQQVFRAGPKSRKTIIVSRIKEILTGRAPKKYVAPNSARVAAFINDNISISSDIKTQYLTLSSESSEPHLLKKLLLSIIDNTDKLFKKKFIEQANDAVKFYQIKISKARSQEHREVLATLIAKEERKLLLATRNGPFVAEILTGPNISLNPTSPRATFILALSIIIGGIFSCGVLLFRNFAFNKHDK